MHFCQISGKSPNLMTAHIPGYTVCNFIIRNKFQAPRVFLLKLPVYFTQESFSIYYTYVISPFLVIFILLKDIKGFVDKFVGVLQDNKFL